MPFMRAPVPIRRTLKYLEQGKLILKDNVRIVSINFNTEHKPSTGIENFVFWHFAQMQYKNPQVQMCVFKNMTPSPFMHFFFDCGSNLALDVDSHDKDTIHTQVLRIFCKTEQTLKAESLATEKKTNPANFGYMCVHECMCEIPGQVPCTRFVHPPLEQRGKYTFMGKRVEE